MREERNLTLRQGLEQFHRENKGYLSHDQEGISSEAKTFFESHDIAHVLADKESINRFARMLLMPKEMVLGLTTSMRNPKTMSTHFEVPESDAQERLLDLT